MTKTTNTDDDFVIFDRWDSKQAQDGIYIEVADQMGNEWGSFKIALFDANVPRIRHSMERSERKAKANAKANGVSSKNKAVNIKAGIDLALDTYLLDWKLVNTAGAPIPFTREKAHAYFGRSAVDEASGETVYPVLWVLDFLFDKARDVTLFQPDDQEEAPEKN